MLQYMRENQGIECLICQIIRESVFNIKHPASCHMSFCALGFSRRMGNAAYIAFRVPGFDQSGVITCAASYVEQAIAALTKQIDQRRISLVGINSLRFLRSYPFIQNLS